MTIKKDFGFVALVFVAVFVVVISGMLLSMTPRANASAPSGLPTRIASSTVPVTVGPGNATNVFSTSTPSCTSRVITTAGQPIMFTISTSSMSAARNVPSAIFGIYQAASTTVTYDSGVWGCDWWNAYGYGASTSITVAQFN